MSLEEFLTAMHLVVLKRNNIDVPETLPPILKPAYLRQRLTRANRKVTKIIFEKVKQTEQTEMFFFFINTHIFIVYLIFWQVVLKPSVPNHHKDLYNGGVDATTPSNIETLNASLLSHQEDELDHAKVDKKELTDVTDTASIVSSPGMYHSQCCNGFENIIRKM